MRSRWIAIVALAGIFLAAAVTQAQQNGTIPEEVLHYPEMIVYNAKLVMMDNHSFGLNTPIGTVAQAMAVRDGKILAVGSNDAILRMAGPRTERIDAKGRMVMPGIIDTHTHIHNGALSNWVAENPQAEKENAEAYSITGKTDAEVVQAITATVKEQSNKQNERCGQHAP